MWHRQANCSRRARQRQRRNGRQWWNGVLLNCTLTRSCSLRNKWLRIAANWGYEYPKRHLWRLWAPSIRYVPNYWHCFASPLAHQERNIYNTSLLKCSEVIFLSSTVVRLSHRRDRGCLRNEACYHVLTTHMKPYPASPRDHPRWLSVSSRSPKVIWMMCLIFQRNCQQLQKYAVNWFAAYGA